MRDSLLAKAGELFMQPGPENVTQILESVGSGDEQAAEKLLPLVYEELRRLAAAKMASEAPGQTLQPTALVHEAWLRICGAHGRNWNGRHHFFAAAAEVMRRILVDRARRRQAAKRGAGADRLDVDELDLASPAPDDELLPIHESLAKLATVDPRKAELVKLRYFLGLSFEETADVLGIAVPTAKKWWAYSRAWLRVDIAGAGLRGSTER